MATRAQLESELRGIRAEIAKLESQLVGLERDVAFSRANPNLADLVESQERTVQRTKDRIAALEQRANSVEAQIAAVPDPAETTPVATPAPPTEDPTTKQADAAASSADVNTNSGNPEDPGPAAVPKTADNQSNDDNPQTSNVSSLGQPTATTAATPVNSPAEKPIIPQPNILDRFASYTYQAAVYMLTPDQFNTFQRSRRKTVNGYNLLFQSGGASNNIGGPQGAGGASQFKTVTRDGVDSVVNASDALPSGSSPDAGRNPYFPNDYYIDSITVENILQGKATMAAHSSTQLKFTVVEPANITLIDNIYKAVQDLQPKNGVNGPINYAAVCYLMVIRFYGYDEQGRLQRAGAFSESSGLTDPNTVVEKYIPFRIKEIKWEVSNKLVSYEFDCAPIGQIVAGGTRRGTVPADYEVSGQTVGELLVGSVAASNTTATGGLRADENQSQAEVNRLDSQNNAPPKASAAQQKSALRAGLIGAINDEQQQRVKEGLQEIADEYEIVFASGAEKIRDATVYKPGPTTNKGATDMGPAPSQNPSGLSPDKGSVNTNSRNLGITAGMQVLQVIELTIRNSNYITNQATTVITEGSTGKSEANGTANTKSFSWYLPIMTVEQLGYDNQRRDYAFRVTYTIVPYTPQDFQSQYFVQPKFRGVAKSYPYWFTGQNTAVLDYKANFNHLYTQTVSGSSVETSALATSRKNFLSGTRELSFVQPQARSTESAQGADGRANEIAANAAEYLYNPASNGEGEISIVGDPAWFQQGSAVGDIDPKNINFDPFNPDGTINFDTNDVLFEIVWQRPEDYELGTGLADPYSRTQNIFGDRQPRQSVIYRATNIVSEFRNGRFVQKVKGTLYRYQVPGQSTTPEGTDARGRQTGASDPRTQGRSNQSLATQLRTGVNLNSIAGGGRGVVGGPSAEELAAYSEARSAQTAAASLSTAAQPAARLAPVAQVDISLLGSGEFSAFTGAAADTVSTLPPAQPVTSNGGTVNQPVTNNSATEPVRIRQPRQITGQATAGALNLPQQGSRDY